MAVAAQPRRLDPADAEGKCRECRVPRRKHPRPGHLVHADVRRGGWSGAELTNRRCSMRPNLLSAKDVSWVLRLPPAGYIKPAMNASVKPSVLIKVPAGGRFTPRRW